MRDFLTFSVVFEQQICNALILRYAPVVVLVKVSVNHFQHFLFLVLLCWRLDFEMSLLKVFSDIKIFVRNTWGHRALNKHHFEFLRLSPIRDVHLLVEVLIDECKFVFFLDVIRGSRADVLIVRL